MLIRPETPADADAIARLVEEAFLSAAHSGGNESEIVAALRRAGALSLSLVAEEEGRLYGHIAFSPVRIGGADLDWVGLAPLSVDLSRRMRGVGAALVRRGLSELRSRGVRGCVVLGDPAYYGRFGFSHDPDLTYAGTGPAFQRLLLTGDAPRGEVAYSAAFA